MSQIADHAPEASPWSPREAELLAVTLGMLQQHGYDRLTVDAVAATARASKATVFRRWPSKAELVLAAVGEAVHKVAVPPVTLEYTLGWAEFCGLRIPIDREVFIVKRPSWKMSTRRSL